MSTWIWIGIASAVAYATKLVGYLVPRSWLMRPGVEKIASTMTIGLLASLTVLNAFSAGPALVVDARLGSLLAAAVALRLRAPFLVVVLVGAAAAAGLRLAGVG